MGGSFCRFSISLDVFHSEKYRPPPVHVPNIGWCFGVPEILSPYQYRSIEGSGEAGSEGAMKEKCSVNKTDHVNLIWYINTVRRTGFLLESLS